MGKIVIGTLIVIAVVTAACSERQSATQGTLTPAVAAATAAATTRAATPAPEKQWAVVKTWSGDGIKDTEQFTVGSEWRIDWDFTPGQFGLLQIYVYDVQNQLAGLAANTQKAGAESSFQHKAGTYYLKVNAMGAWKIAVQDRR